MAEKRSAMTAAERMAKSAGWRVIKERALDKGMIVHEDTKILVDGDIVRFVRWDGEQWIFIEIPETKKIRST